MTEHSTVPILDHASPEGLGLYSHLVHDHKQHPVLMHHRREWERRELHDQLHAQP